jgi:hypothetical protein
MRCRRRLLSPFALLLRHAFTRAVVPRFSNHAQGFPFFHSEPEKEDAEHTCIPVVFFFILYCASEIRQPTHPQGYASPRDLPCSAAFGRVKSPQVDMQWLIALALTNGTMDASTIAGVYAFSEHEAITLFETKIRFAREWLFCCTMVLRARSIRDRLDMPHNYSYAHSTRKKKT